MPKDNNQTPVTPPPTVAPTMDDKPPMMFPDEVAPPMPQPGPAPVSTVTTTTTETKLDMTTPTPLGSGSAAPSNDVIDTVMPAVVTTTQNKKYAGGKIIATILGLFLLVGGVGAGVYLTGQNQDFRERASLGEGGGSVGAPTCAVDSDCPPDYSACSNGVCVGAGGCFLPGTLVNSSNSSKPIENTKVGDTVLSFDEKGEVVESKVNKIYEVKRDHYYSLTAGGVNVKATAEHPFYIGNNEYKETKDLKTGDTIYTLVNKDLKPQKIESIVKIDEPTVAYNLSVDNTHTFFANNIAVHNKTAATLAVCGSGLDCTAGTLNGGNSCINSAGDTLSCCSPGSQNQNGTCVQSAPQVCGSTTCYPGVSECSGGKCVAINRAPGGSCGYLGEGSWSLIGSSYICSYGGDLTCNGVVGGGGDPCKLPDGTSDCAKAGMIRCKCGPNAYVGAAAGSSCNDVCGAAGISCSNGCNESPGETPPPTVTASCQNIKAYSSNFTLLTNAQLRTLDPGTTVNFCVTGSATGGSFNKARFTINGVLKPETTTRRPGALDYCQSFVIPTGVTNFVVVADIHHGALGWK